jgi:NAD(P)-dependent dehydrogenase (short-subunit alcohol dehydrogenase family)
VKPDGSDARFQASIDMSGRVALVTGGASGMGRASARLFARCGAKVVIADVDGPGADETVELIGMLGGEAIAVRVDVSVSDDVQRMVAATVDAYGRLDYAHNNAGIIEAQLPVADYPEDGWDRIIRTNLTSVFLCMKYELPVMVSQRGGAIVNVISETTYKGGLGDVAYTSSKHGVYGATTVAAIEYAGYGIRVNAVAPGNVDTAIMQRARKYLTPARVAEMESAQPIGRFSTPEEVAQVVVWLCSDSAFLINGAKIPVDAGWNLL